MPQRSNGLQKLSMEALVAFEKKHRLWNLTLFDYPLWIHCREPLLSTGMMVERQINRPSLKSMVKSFWGTMKFLVTQHKYDKLFFLMERAELLEIYNQEKSTKKLLFLNPEQERVYESGEYISSDFLSLLRFISRKVAFRIFSKKYQQSIAHLETIGCDSTLNKYIQVAMGDALFLKFLSLILSKKNQKFYTGAVIPMGEKFVNALNSYEVQHGVIHPAHIGYMGLPEIKNTLILYDKRYEKIMREGGYMGKLMINAYKKTFFEKTTSRYFPVVIYTQPTQEMQSAVNTFFKTHQPTNVFIQKHPKDYFEYAIDKHFFVTATTPFEVGYPIMYLSSIIENFTLYHKRCYIYDLHYADIDLEAFLSIYTMGSTSQMVIMENLEDIYKTIMKEIACQK